MFDFDKLAQQFVQPTSRYYQTQKERQSKRQKFAETEISEPFGTSVSEVSEGIEISKETTIEKFEFKSEQIIYSESNNQREEEFVYSTPMKVIASSDQKPSQSTIEQTPNFVEVVEDSPANLIYPFTPME